jgi:carbonic anhydrase
MHKRIWLVGILAVFWAGCQEQSAPEGVQAEANTIHWGYDEADGPGVWADLSPEFSLCREGQVQAPIDLTDAQAANLDPMDMNYQPASLRIIRHEHLVDVINSGHTIQINYDEGSTLTVEATEFELVQYHFHVPSEHTVDGESFPMEMHLVHVSGQGEIAVLSVLIKEGSHNPAFDPVVEHIPLEIGGEEHLEHVQVEIDDLLPADGSTFRYSGSWTTPPCSEGVRWFVFVQALELSPQQIQSFARVISGNNRPIQPRNGRDLWLHSPQ